MSKTSRDLLVALTCLVLGVVGIVFIIPSQVPLPRFSSGGTTPRAIPLFCAWLIICMAVLMLIRTLRSNLHSFSLLFRELVTGLKNRNAWKRTGMAALVFALCVLYYIGFSEIGFIVTTLVLFPCFALVLGCRKPLTILITDIVLSFGVYYFFAKGLSCYLPGWAPF